MRRLAVGLAGGLLATAAALGYAIWQIGRPPANRPADFVRQQRRPPGARVVVCLGASMVHGRVGASFVEQLRARLPAGERGWVVVNAGVNGDTAWHALQRLDSVIACDPDFVVVLVGTNDVLCTLGAGSWRAYRGTRRLAAPPSLPAYEETLRAIVRTLHAQTRVRVALCALPVLGEALDSPANAAVRAFNAAIRRVAGAEGATYLPIFEDEARYLARPGIPGRPFAGTPWESLRFGFLGALQHYLLGWNWDAVARRRGLRLKVDLIHPNSREAGLIAERTRALLTAAPPG